MKEKTIQFDFSKSIKYNNLISKYLIENNISKIIFDLYQNRYYMSEESKKVIKDNDLVIIDYFEDWKRFFQSFLVNKKNNKEKSYKYNDANILDITFNKNEKKNFDKILKNSDSWYMFIVWEKKFQSYSNNFLWYCPIEYYFDWLNKNNIPIKKLEENKLKLVSLSPYSYVSTKIKEKFKEDFKKIGIDHFYISHKEKFWVWVFSWIYIEIKNVNYDLSKLIEIDENLFYKIVYHIEKYLIEYNNFYLFTKYDYKEEWKWYVWLWE